MIYDLLNLGLFSTLTQSHQCSLSTCPGSWERGWGHRYELGTALASGGGRGSGGSRQTKIPTVRLAGKAAQNRGSLLVPQRLAIQQPEAGVPPGSSHHPWHSSNCQKVIRGNPIKPPHNVLMDASVHRNRIRLFLFYLTARQIANSCAVQRPLPPPRRSPPPPTRTPSLGPPVQARPPQDSGRWHSGLGLRSLAARCRGSGI